MEIVPIICLWIVLGFFVVACFYMLYILDGIVETLETIRLEISRTHAWLRQKLGKREE